MGLFTRKNSKPNSTLSDHVSTHSTTSSLKSPKMSTTTNGNHSPTTPMTPTIPKIPMPKQPDPGLDPAGYLRSIGSVRERCALIHEKATRNQLNHFDVDMAKFDDCTKFVVSIIKRDFAPDYSQIPAHGRWQHFNVGGRDRVGQLLTSWPSAVDTQERTRRLLDLFLVSVLLDAGAGTEWSYKSKENGKVYRRSEGLAVASLEMFKTGLFSGDEEQPCRVDAVGLRRLTVESMAKGLQVTEQNQMSGLKGRTGLLMRLADALEKKKFFGQDQRPGNMLDYLLSHPSTHASSVPIIPLTTLWDMLMNGLAPIWPESRTVIEGVPIGDAWPLSTMPATTSSHPAPWECIVPFHKLTQWLCYSLMQPMTKLMNFHFAGAELMTGLPEYRNGGLFVDTGCLTLKDADMKRGLELFRQEHERDGKKVSEVVPMFRPDDDVIVEWRAVTVGFLDLLHEEVNSLLGLGEADKLSLVQMLEAGSWKGGREIAEVSRPNTKEPPIMILSDGTVF